MAHDRPVILCIDDDPDILEFLRIVLEAEGLRYAGADTGEEGLRVYKEVAPDVVIVDLMMEEVDSGALFARELMILGNQAPVFMLSSVGDDLSMMTDYTTLGLAGVFQKPLEREHFLSVLKTALAETGT